MKLHYDIRDLFRAVRLGWSGKKIWIGLVGLLASYVGYTVLVLLAYWRAGVSGSEIWHRYGLFPGAPLGTFDALGSTLHVLGMLWTIAVMLIATSMMCKVTYQQLRGDDFYSSGDAWRFARAHWAAVLFGPIAVLALFAFFTLTGIVIGLVCRWVPVLGELVFALSFIPIFFAALVAVFMAIVFWVSVMMSPAIVGTLGEDALEVVIQSFSLTWSQPWRLFLYGFWIKLVTVVGLILLGAFAMAAIWLITWACGLFMDLKLANMFDLASHYLPWRPRRWDLILANLPSPGAASGAERWGGRVLGVMLIFITGMVLAYTQAVYASGVSLIYVILRKRKDDENLLEWETATEAATEEAAPTAPAHGTDHDSEEGEDDTADSKAT